jgi:hypothetical protein
MSKVKVLLAFFTLLLCSYQSFSQVDTSETMKKRKLTVNNAVLIAPHYTVLFPVGEIAKRFGTSYNVGLNISYKIKGNWVLGVEGAYLWSRKVKEVSILDSISTYTTGQIIGNDGSLNDIPLQMSGFQIAVRVGKIFPTSKKHPNSGVMASIAPGFIQHKIWINADNSNIPQLNTTYRKGYDRLTNGSSINAFVGYLYLERKKFLSVYGGIDFTLGFTQNRRAWNFDTMKPDTHQRLDMFIGIKLGWVIPIFTNKDDVVYYY